MPETNTRSVKTAEEAPSLEQAEPTGALAELLPVRHRARAGDLLIGDYTSQTGHRMKVVRRESVGRYAFTVKDASGAVVLQSTARNFTDMSMTIEVWKMARADPLASSSTEEGR